MKAYAPLATLDGWGQKAAESNRMTRELAVYFLTNFEGRGGGS